MNSVREKGGQEGAYKVFLGFFTFDVFLVFFLNTWITTLGGEENLAGFLFWTRLGSSDISVGFEFWLVFFFHGLSLLLFFMLLVLVSVYGRPFWRGASPIFPPLIAVAGLFLAFLGVAGSLSWTDLHSLSFLRSLTVFVLTACSLVFFWHGTSKIAKADGDQGQGAGKKNRLGTFLVFLSLTIVSIQIFLGLAYRHGKLNEFYHMLGAGFTTPVLAFTSLYLLWLSRSQGMKPGNSRLPLFLLYLLTFQLVLGLMSYFRWSLAIEMEHFGHGGHAGEALSGNPDQEGAGPPPQLIEPFGIEGIGTEDILLALGHSLTALFIFVVVLVESSAYFRFPGRKNTEKQ